MWRTLVRTTSLITRPVRVSNGSIFSIMASRRPYSSEDKKGLVEKIELDQMLNNEIERMKKNKALLPEEEVVPAEYKSVLKELDIEYERTLEDCREAVRDPEFKEYWTLLNSRIKAAELAWLNDPAPITKQTREAFNALIEEIIQTTDEEFFALMKDRRRKEKETGIKAPELDNSITDDKADEMIREYLGLGYDLKPESMTSYDAIKSVKDTPAIDLNALLEEGTLKSDTKTKNNSNNTKEQSENKSTELTESNPNTLSTETNQNDKLYDDYERLVLFSQRDFQDQSREAAADRILGHLKMRERDKVLKVRREKHAKEEAQFSKEVDEMFNREPKPAKPDEFFELPDLFGHSKK